MATFTDEDLKRLKAELVESGGLYDYKLPELVARLEAAEKYAQLTNMSTTNFITSSGDDSGAVSWWGFLCGAARYGWTAISASVYKGPPHRLFSYDEFLRWCKAAGK